jgi:hypothetical protein
LPIPRLSFWRGRPSSITLADRARDAGQWELAARHYREALARNPHNPPIWVQYGHVMKQWGHVAEAECAYRRAIELNPNIADAHVQHALKEQGGAFKAAAAYHQGFTLDRTPPPASELPHPASGATPQPAHHYIKTIHGTYLCIDKATGRVQHKGEIDESSLPLHYFEFEPGAKYGFFTPAGPFDRFFFGDVVAFGGILPVRRVQLSAKSTAFQHVVHSRLICAEGQSSSDVVFNRHEANEWETFSLHRVRCEPFPQRYALATALISPLGEPPSALSFADAILSYQGNGQDALVALCFDRLTIDEFVALLDRIRVQLPCRQSLGNGLLRQLLELRAASTSDTPFVPECLSQPGDLESAFWMGRILPELMAWRRDRTRFLGPDHHTRLAPDLDFLDRLQNGVSIRSTGRLYNFLVRFTTESRRDICVVATARNEGMYLLEWLAYHKSIGIDAFFIYSNNNDDGSDALLRRLSEAGAIYWLENIVEGDTVPQFKAYNHALNVLPNVLDYHWTLVLDLDEFLVINPDRFGNLSDYLGWQEQQPPIDAIGFNWIFMSSSGLNKWSGDFLRSRFTKRWGGPDIHIKSMFRPQRFLSSQCHYPVTDWRVPVAMRDSSGYPHLNYYGGEGIQPAFLLHPKAEAAWVNHYFFKSAEEFVWKRSRNTGDHSISENMLTPHWLRMFASQHQSTDLAHDDRILRCGRDFQKYYDALLTINGVPEIIEEIRETFCAELKRKKMQLLNNSVFDDADELVKDFMDCLRS